MRQKEKPRLVREREAAEKKKRETVFYNRKTEKKIGEYGKCNFPIQRKRADFWK